MDEKTHICEYCGKTFMSTDFKRSFCPTTNCRDLSIAKHAANQRFEKMMASGRVRKCPYTDCEYVWMTRGLSGAICPRCKRTDFVAKDNVIGPVVICHNCGAWKPAEKTVCLECRQPNTEMNHYAGLTRANWQRFVGFIHRYGGSDPFLVSIKSIVINDDTALNRPIVVERREPESGVESTPVSEVSKEEPKTVFEPAPEVIEETPEFSEIDPSKVVDTPKVTEEKIDMDDIEIIEDPVEAERIFLEEMA